MTPPSDFTCPLTKNIMVDPVVSPQGINFERSAILKWTQDGNNFCPVTSAPLRFESLRTSTALQWKIKYFQMKHNDPSSDESGEQEQAPSNLRCHPQNMICPLTKKVMVDPVMTKRGHNYERAAIFKWIAIRGEVCPMTGKSLNADGLVSNHKLSWQIDQWEHKLLNGETHHVLPAQQQQPEEDAEVQQERVQPTNKENVVPQVPDKLKVVPRMDRNSRGLVGSFLKKLHIISKQESEGSHQSPTPLDQPEESILMLLGDVSSTLELAC